MEAEDVFRILDAAVIARGSVPEFMALALQDWIARRGFTTLYLKPGSL